MKPTTLAAWLLAASLLSAADAPNGDRPGDAPQPRGDQPQVQRPQRDRGDAQPRVQRQSNPAPQLSGWVYIPPQGGQNGPIPPKPDFIPQPPNQGRPDLQPQPGNGPDVQPQRTRGDAPQTQNQPQAQRRGAALTPDEQHKLQETMAKLKDDAAVKEAREVLTKAQKEVQEAARKEREITEAAALKLDPTLAPIFEKMHKANINSNGAGRTATPPTPEQIQAFREQLRERAGAPGGVRRDEPAR